MSRKDWVSPGFTVLPHVPLFSVFRIAVEAMRTLPPGVVTMALNNALWSVEEEAVLARIPSVSLVFIGNIHVC